jgi:hypothetical protein
METNERLSHVIEHQGNMKHLGKRGGWIYFIRCNEFVKIGRCRAKGNRLTALQTGCPYKLTQIAMLASDNAKRDEATLHEMFKAYHERGEWFRLPEDTIRLIALLARDCPDPVPVNQLAPIGFPVKPDNDKPLPRSKRWLMPGWTSYSVKAVVK